MLHMRLQARTHTPYTLSSLWEIEDYNAEVSGLGLGCACLKILSLVASGLISRGLCLLSWTFWQRQKDTHATGMLRTPQIDSKFSAEKCAHPIFQQALVQMHAKCKRMAYQLLLFTSKRYAMFHARQPADA